MPTTLRHAYKPHYNQNNLIMETDPTLVLYLPNPNILRQNNDLNPYIWPDYSGKGNHAQIYGATWTEKGLAFDGIDDYACVGLQLDGSGQPFTVYGWSEITIAEWVYAIKPKPNAYYSKFSTIGDYLVDPPSTFNGTINLSDYTILWSYWATRKPDGTWYDYYYNWISEANRWTFVVRRFTSDREFSVWINGEKKYSVTVPSDYKTVLEWNPENATYPERYQRFVMGSNNVLGDLMSVLYDNVRIYSRALSDGEIQALYQNGTERFYKRTYL